MRQDKKSPEAGDAKANGETASQRSNAGIAQQTGLRSLGMDQKSSMGRFDGSSTMPNPFDGSK